MASSPGQQAAQKRYRERHPERCREALRRWISKNRKAHYANRLDWRMANTSRIMFYDARKRAKRKGIPFNLTVEDVQIPKCCPVLGIPLRYGTGFRHDNSPSLDRVNNRRGYVKGNVCVISWRANHLKSNGTLTEFKQLITWWRKQK